MGNGQADSGTFEIIKGAAQNKLTEMVIVALGAAVAGYFMWKFMPREEAERVFVRQEIHDLQIQRLDEKFVEQRAYISEGFEDIKQEIRNAR